MPIEENCALRKREISFSSDPRPRNWVERRRRRSRKRGILEPIPFRANRIQIVYANYVIERINGKNCKRENCNRREDLKKKNNVSTLSRFKRRSDATLRDEEDEWKNWKKRIIIVCSKRRRSDNVTKSRSMEKLENNNNNNRSIEVEIACNVISTFIERRKSDKTLQDEEDQWKN